MADEKKARMQLNELRRNDGAEIGNPDRSIPEHLEKHFHKDGNAYRSAHRPDKIDFVDRVTRIHAYRPVSQFTARAMAEVVKERGWKSAEITGDKDWRSKAYVELESRGVHVDGHEPTERDLRILAVRQDRREAEQNPKVQAFMAAKDAAARTTAVNQYPELKNAFALREAISKMGAQISDAKAGTNWVGMMNDRVIRAIHRGEPLPEVKVKEAAQSRDAQSQDGHER